MTPDAMARLNTARLDSIYRLFGSAAIYKGNSILVCHSGVRSRKQLSDGGFDLSHTFLARARMDQVATIPLLESDLTVKGTRYVIQEVLECTLGGEWLMGLRAR